MSNKTLRNQFTVVKVGGSLDGMPRSLLEDIRRLRMSEVPVIVVHGGGNAITAEMNKRGLDVEKVGGLRVTSRESIPVIREVMCNIGERITRRIGEEGMPAVHINGHRRVLKVEPIEGLGLVGRVTEVSLPRILSPAGEGKVVVVTPLGWRETSHYNVNADDAAAAIAKEIQNRVHNEKRVPQSVPLFYLTDSDGIRGVDGTKINTATMEDIRRLIAQGIITGGMIPKAEAAIEAAGRGATVRILDGNAPMSLLHAVFRGEGGTAIRRED